ncbi:hypothetical protein [Mycobacterium riyadhense]|uniref:hypothetical protein n=1 Tax=Mycobacterium riyadhense TaxID=486698 RepID=UPI001957DFFF|nr:hypothetical protein [Mycobacterium riyadhense]
MTTTSDRNDLIDRARRRYLAANPLRFKSIPTVDGNTGKPTGDSWTFPNIGDIQIIGCKLGMEYLAVAPRHQRPSEPFPDEDEDKPGDFDEDEPW